MHSINVVLIFPKVNFGKLTNVVIMLCVHSGCRHLFILVDFFNSDGPQPKDLATVISSCITLIYLMLSSAVFNVLYSLHLKLKIQSAIRFQFREKLLIFELNTQSTYTPPPVLLKHRVDWLVLFMCRSEPLCLFPIYKARNVYEHRFLAQ